MNGDMMALCSVSTDSRWKETSQVRLEQQTIRNSACAFNLVLHTFLFFKVKLLATLGPHRCSGLSTIHILYWLPDFLQWTEIPWELCILEWRQYNVEQNIGLFSAWWLSNGRGTLILKWWTVSIASVLALADTAHSDTGPDPWGLLVPSATGRMTGSRMDNPQINHRQSTRVIGQKGKVRKKSDGVKGRMTKTEIWQIPDWKYTLSENRPY